MCHSQVLTWRTSHRPKACHMLEFKPLTSQGRQPTTNSHVPSTIPTHNKFSPTQPCKNKHSPNIKPDQSRKFLILDSAIAGPVSQQPPCASHTNRPAPLTSHRRFPAAPRQPSTRPHALARPTLATSLHISSHLAAPSQILSQLSSHLANISSYLSPPLANTGPPVAPPRTCPATPRPTSQMSSHPCSHPTSHLRCHLIDLC